MKKPRTAGLCGRAAGACDCGPLSCAKIERPPPLEKPSCKVWLFAQDRSREYRQKVTATTPSQTAFHRVFQLLAQTAHVCFHSRKRVHTRLSEKNRTQGHTRRNRGVLDGGGITTLGSFCADRKPCVARGVERQTLPLLGLGRGCSQRTQKAFGTAMRSCASLFRGVAAPLGCVIFSVSDEITACTPYSRNFFQFSRRSSLCCSCASCFSTRSFSARSCSRVFSFVIVLDPFS